MPDLNSPAQDQKSQRNRENDLRDLRCDQDLAFVQPISERTGSWSQRKRRDTSSEIYQAKQDRLVGESTHDPALRHHLHPGAAVGNERTNDVTAKSTRPQKRQRLWPDPFFFCAHRQDS